MIVLNNNKFVNRKNRASVGVGSLKIPRAMSKSNGYGMEVSKVGQIVRKTQSIINSQNQIK